MSAPKPPSALVAHLRTIRRGMTRMNIVLFEYV
jgi:hypothetical protein